MTHSSGLIDASSDFADVNQVLHVAYFVPVNWGGQDRVSRSIVDFQHHREPQTQQWIRLAESVMPPLACDVIVRAMSSNESTSNGKSPIDLLCQRLSQKLNVPFAPERLWKYRRTGAVKNAGGRTARRKILVNAYEFYGTNLSPKARILLVDDLITTGATAATIASAIRKELPEAEVRLFTLARTDPHLVQMHLEGSAIASPEETELGAEVNPHLDERYFFRSTSPALAQPQVRTRKAPPVRAPVLPQPPDRPVELTPLPTVTVSSEKVFGEEEEHVPLAARSPVPPQAEPAQTPSPHPQMPVQLTRPVSRPGLNFKPLAIIVGLAFVVFLGFFLINQLTWKERPKTDFPPPQTTVAPSVLPVRPPQPPPPQVKRERRPKGFITVPSIGLRAGPSLDTTILPIEVKEGEEVVILQSVSADSGPDWVQVRTSAGTVGWVFTGVVAPDTSRARRP
jgi:hypothetical protein